MNRAAWTVQNAHKFIQINKLMSSRASSRTGERVRPKLELVNSEPN